MDEFQEIEISKIQSLENIRTRISSKDVQELMQNIKQQGLLQPIGVWVTKKGEYIIAYGNRRLVACEKLGWRTITAKLLGELSVEDMLIINTSENLHRKDITVAELGRICHLLYDKGLSYGEIAVRLGVAVSRVKMAVNSFQKIPERHRKDVVFMKAGQKRKLGKIPASLYNTLMALQQEVSLSEREMDNLIKIVKREDLSIAQVRVLSVLLREGATIRQALKVLDKYTMRRINLPIKKSAEQSLFIANNIHGQGRVRELFKRILQGQIEGRKELVFG